jgi:hypothetical protein
MGVNVTPFKATSKPTCYFLSDDKISGADGEE